MVAGPETIESQEISPTISHMSYVHKQVFFRVIHDFLPLR